MADFINFEAECEDEHSDQEEFSNCSDIESFTDDTEINDDETYGFQNVQVDINQVLRESQEQAQIRLQNYDEISNLGEGSEDEESEIDEFDKSSKLITEFNESLLPKVEAEQQNEHNNLIRVILYAIRYEKENKTNICDIEDLEKVSSLEQIIEQFNQKKFTFSHDLQEFNNISYQINDILSKHNNFLRIFELKNKYRQFMVKKT